MADDECKFTNNNALITGGSRGIGYALAEELASRDYNLILVALDKQRLEKAKKNLTQQFQIEVVTLSIDLTKPEGPRKLVERIQQITPNIDILINNAGFGAAGSFHKNDLSRYNQMIQLNISALLALTHLMLNQMLPRDDDAYIMNVASTAAFQPGPGMAVYYASKSFVYSFSEALAKELNDSPVHVSTLCPGPTSTDFHETAGTSGRIINNQLLSMKPQYVAHSGIKNMFKGRSLIIPGILNKIGVISVKLLPRKLLLKIVEFIHQRSE